MTERSLLILLAAGGSLALLLGAFAFQYLGGLAPCHLCLLQRWPHAAAVLIGILALTFRWRLLCWLGALAALTTAGLGAYHTGVERGWWPGPETCSGNSLAGISAQDLLDPTKNIAPVVRCDQIAWEMFGLSMASWNVIASLVLMLLWIAAARRQP
ncbi:disulfide bond formation protein B [Tabrizicola sp. J26]|uniref:disulfide bond formation protein B n=1 Tax=Alitabrizicola rongguiensis TaxID=2909234 RepID=UPI001F48753C|nr:disulfide bond formation protein B [Tabrizicola rongguiensis]MCF1709984.1 disulfide bond formation protein B [Tabrizicola rongguiensis]